MISQLPKIAIVGRPNVGKSTLFNRLVGRRQAIVDDIPGVTRDRQYGLAKWRGTSFQVIDTGGFVPGRDAQPLAQAVYDQVFLAIAEAQVVVLVVDGRAGLSGVEAEIAKLLRKQKVPVVVAVNKIDNLKQEALVSEFHRLGFSHTFGVSAEKPRGMDQLCETLLSFFPTSVKLAQEKVDVKLAIVGQPNVGKSTLLNALLGADRAVVSPTAGTTLDPLNARFERGSKVFELVDTAGIKRRRSTKGKIEKVGVLKAFESIRKAQLILVVVDAAQGLSARDMKVLNYAEEQGRALMIILNKWDLVASTRRLKEFKEVLQNRFKRHQDIPLMALSAKTGRGIKKLFGLMDQVDQNYRRRIGTGELNRVFQKALKSHPPPAVSGKAIQISYLTQSGEAPPRFVLFANHPKLVPETYLRYLERVFRKNFDFTGVPLRWVLRKKM